MIPANYLSPAQATTILNALRKGTGTTPDSTGTASDLGYNGFNVIPSLLGLPTDLVNRVITTDMSGSTTVFSTTGLASSSITMLNEIRNRVIEAVSALYDDQNTPIQSPFYGLTVGSAEYNHMRDAIIHMIFRFDSRYLLRKRSDVGNGAESPEYELPSRYQLTNYPLIIGRLRRHGFDDVNEIDDDGTDGAYQIKTSTPHGYYTGMTVTTDGSNPGATTTQEVLGLDSIYQTNASAIGSVTSKFVLDTGSVNHFINGQRIVTNDPTGITILDWQPDRYVKRLSDTEFEFYRDAALTDKIVPGWGDITDIHTANVGAANETLAVSTAGTYIVLPEASFVFDRDVDSNNDLSIFEQKYGISVDPLTGVWSTTTGAGFSIVDGQITNFASMSSAGWQNINDFDTPLYFKKLTDTTFELYYDSALTTKFYPGTDVADTVASFSQSGSDWSVNFSSDYPPIISGQSVSFRNTDTNFSNALGVSTFTPIQTTTPNLDYNVVAYSAGGFIAAGASSAGGTEGNYYESTDGIVWTLGSWTSPTIINSIAYNPTNNRTVALEQGSTYVQTRLGTGSWSQANRQSGGNTAVTKVVTFDLSGTPRFLVAPNLANQSWTYSETGAAGTWASFSPTRFVGLGYTLLDITVGGTSGSDLVAVMWTGPSGNIATTKSTDGGATWSTFTTVLTGISAPVKASISYSAGKYAFIFRDKAYYSTNGTSWTAVTLSAAKTWHNLKNLNGVLYANADDGSTSSIKSVDGGVNWTTVTLSHGGIEIATYYNGRFVGVKNPTSTPAFVHSLDAIDWANYDDSTWTLSANHLLENGQPIRFNAGSGSTFDIEGYTAVVPRAVWAKTTGLAANEFKLYLDEALTQPWTPWYGATISAKSLTSIIYRLAFYAKRTDVDTFGLFVDSAMTNPYSQTVSITGFTTGDVVRTGHVLSMSAPVNGYLQPAFYATTESYNSFKLWADAAFTVPYPFYQKNGGLSTLGLTGVTSNPDTSDNQGDIGLNAYTSYLTGGSYRLYNVGYKQAFVANEYALSGSVKPVYYVNKISDTVLELFVDSARTISVRSGGGSPNAPVISTPATSGGFDVTFYDEYQYRLSNIECVNIGGGRYFYTDYNDGGAVKVNATWSLIGYPYYTDHITSQDIGNIPTLTVYEYANTNAGTYYGMLRKTKASGADTNTSPITVNTAVVGGVGSPLVFNLNDPGQFRYDSQFVFGIGAQPNVGTAPAADPLDYVGSQWDTESNLDNINDRAWPTTIQPSNVTWTIEQPNQTFESHNLNRYGRARDVTQYRFRLMYAPMTRDQFRPFLAVIHAARGSFKPFKFTPPKNFQGNSVTIDLYKRDLTVPGVVRVRDTITSGQQIITIDGLPPNLSAAYTAGHAVGLEANGLGGWGVATHDVKTNAYGEANIRINNPIPVTSNLGDAVFSDAPPLDCYLDGNSVEVKVDTLGYHYLEVDLVTKRIF